MVNLNKEERLKFCKDQEFYKLMSIMMFCDDYSYFFIKDGKEEK